MVELDYWSMPFPRNAEHLQAMQEILREQAAGKAPGVACVDAKKADTLPPPVPAKDSLPDAPSPDVAPAWWANLTVPNFKWP